MPISTGLPHRDESVLVLEPTIVARTVTLAHPVEDVFAAVMSPEVAPQIDPAVREWTPDRRPIGLATHFTIRGRFQWLPIRATSAVTTWEPPHRATFEAIRPTWPVRLVASHTFEPDPTGTRYTWSTEIVRRGPVGRLAARLVAPLLERTFADQHRTLAAWLDEHPGAAGFAEL